MKKLLKVMSLAMALLMLITTFAGCSKKASVEKAIVGEWFYSEDKSIKIRKDGTWKSDDSYGSGKWKYLDDDVIELTDFYGSTKEITIKEDENGEYITYNKKSYKNSYPVKSTDKTDNSTDKSTNNSTNSSTNNSTNNSTNSSTNNSTNNSTDNSTENSTETNGTSKIKINPFEGIEFLVSGISPYCKLAINNSNCSYEAQMYVKYTMDKEEYKNGDMAVITASFMNAKDTLTYSLTSTKMEYKIENQSEYLTSMAGVDISTIKFELQDFITAKEGSAEGGDYRIDFMGIEFYYTSYNDNVPFEEGDEHKIDMELQEATHFSVLKAQNRGDTGKDFNILSFVYNVKLKGKATDWYICIMAENIIKNADGTLSWSSKRSEGRMDFTTSKLQGNLDNAISTLIMTNSIEYNISRFIEQ